MKKLIVAATAALALLAAGCGEHTSSSRALLDHGPADVIQMPNGFPNVATKCDQHGHRLFTASNEGPNKGYLVVVDDSRCGSG